MKVLFAFAFIIACLSVSCKSRQSESQTKEDFLFDIKSNEDPVFVLVGGNASCASGSFNIASPMGHVASKGTDGMGMEKEFKLLLSSFEEKRDASEAIVPLQWVKSCFRGVRDGRTIVFKSIHDRRDLITSVDSVAPGAAIPESEYEAWFGPLVAKIKTVSEMGGKERPVLMIGHSFGGWLAMQLVQRLPRGRVRGLVTFDPISLKHCTPDVYATSVENYRDALNSRPEEQRDKVNAEALAVQNSAEGCREFPKDIDVKQLLQFVGADAWFHYYQTKDILLHSGPNEFSRNFYKSQFIEGAENTNRVTITAPNHSKAARDDRAWTEMRNLFLERAGLKAAYNDLVWDKGLKQRKTIDEQSGTMMSLTGDEQAGNVNLEDGLMFIDQ
jgi:pimeloyl-ACP methyl ester carboxylesterase